MKFHAETLSWVLDGWQGGRLNKTEFNIGFYCACKMDWKTRQVRAYSAAQVCKFWGEDADRANLKRYERGLKTLEGATHGAVRDDYRKCMPGFERTFNVFMPWTDPWGEQTLSGTTDGAAEQNDGSGENAVSLSVAQCRKGNVAVDVAREGSVDVGMQRGCEQTVGEMSQGLSQGFLGILSIPNQGAEKPPLQEREPSKPPLQGGLTSPRPSVEGGTQGVGPAQTPLGFSQGDRPRRGALDAKQAEGLNEIVGRFRALWSRHHRGFDPDAAAVFALLKRCSPLEVLNAYRTFLAPNGERIPNKPVAKFFDEGAANSVDVIRRNGKAFTFARGVYDYTNELADFYDLEQSWRDLFCSDMPLVFRSSSRGEMHFYHPKLDGVLQAWNAANEAAEARKESERKAETERQNKEAERQREESEFKRRRAEECQRAQAKRRDITERLSAELKDWAFDGTTWTKYGGSVRLSEDGSQAIITDSRGKVSTHATIHLDEVAWCATAID